MKRPQLVAWKAQHSYETFDGDLKHYEVGVTFSHYLWGDKTLCGVYPPLHDKQMIAPSPPSPICKLCQKTYEAKMKRGEFKS